MNIVQKNKEHLGKLGEATGNLIVSPMESLVGMLTFENPKAIRTSTRYFLSTLFKTPFRLAGSTAAGVLKGGVRTAWNFASGMPILPFTTLELQELTGDTRKKLGDLSKSVMRYNLTGGPSQEETLAADG